VSQIAAAIEGPEALATSVDRGTIVRSAGQGVIATNGDQAATGITGDQVAIATSVVRAALAAIAIPPPIVSAVVWAYLIRQSHVRASP
jgi:hypothetical protein